MEEACKCLLRAKVDVIGFDLEWRVRFIKGQAPGDVALMQLCYQELAPPPVLRELPCQPCLPPQTSTNQHVTTQRDDTIAAHSRCSRQHLLTASGAPEPRATLKRPCPDGTPRTQATAAPAQGTAHGSQAASTTQQQDTQGGSDAEFSLPSASSAGSNREAGEASAPQDDPTRWHHIGCQTRTGMHRCLLIHLHRSGVLSRASLVPRAASVPSAVSVCVA